MCVYSPIVVCLNAYTCASVAAARHLVPFAFPGGEMFSVTTLIKDGEFTHKLPNGKADMSKDFFKVTLD